MLRDKQSSTLAAAVVHAARIEEFNAGRKKLELSPGIPQPLYTTDWPSELETLTQWQVKDLEDIAQLLIKLNSQQPADNSECEDEEE